ncbi:MAG: hypothetical protein L3J47_00010 [Sulfurovum sp.]|nr:hypothetical protein [Sulfurovum sp.]
MSWKKELVKGVLHTSMEAFFTTAASHISERLFARREEKTGTEEEDTTKALGTILEDFDYSDWHW